MVYASFNKTHTIGKKRLSGRHGSIGYLLPFLLVSKLKV